jgi:hypothetical protein
MRYRMEMLEDETLVVRNVETDLILGFINRPCMDDPQNPNRLISLGCVVLSRDLNEIATIPATTVQRPLEHASVAVANYEAYYGYPDFRHVEERPQPDRVERSLGTVVADAASVLARAFLEYQNGGVKAETKAKFGDLMTRLYDFWVTSSYHSFNGERQVLEPYFANLDASQPRLLFWDAAQQWGMDELRSRHPDASDKPMQAVLSMPLDELERTLNRLVPLKPILSQHQGFKVSSPSGQPH